MSTLIESKSKENNQQLPESILLESAKQFYIKRFPEKNADEVGMSKKEFIKILRQIDRSPKQPSNTPQK